MNWHTISLQLVCRFFCKFLSIFISLLEGQSQDANKNTQEFTKKTTNQLQAYGMPVHSNPHLIFSKESLTKNTAKLSG